MEAISVAITIVYIALIILYIMLAVKIWNACTAIIEIKDQVKDMSFRDTTRYVAEINKGKITEADQKEAKELFNS